VIIVQVIVQCRAGAKCKGAEVQKLCSRAGAEVHQVQIWRWKWK